MQGTSETLSHVTQQLDEVKLELSSQVQKIVQLKGVAHAQQGAQTAAEVWMAADALVEKAQREEGAKQQLELQQKVTELSQQLGEQHGVNVQLRQQVVKMSQQLDRQRQQLFDARRDESVAVSGQGAGWLIGNFRGNLWNVPNPTDLERRPQTWNIRDGTEDCQTNRINSKDKTCMLLASSFMQSHPFSKLQGFTAIPVPGLLAVQRFTEVSVLDTPVPLLLDCSLDFDVLYDLEPGRLSSGECWLT